MMDITVKRGTGGQLSRSIIFHGHAQVGEEATLIGPGSYGVKLRRDPEDLGRVLCDGTWNLLDAPVIAPLAQGQDYDYTFKLLSDCNRNGIDDAEEIADDFTLDMWPLDGRIDSCFGWCDPDYNCDGAVNGFDVEATEQAVNGDFSNFCGSSADLNHDGSTNGFDIEVAETTTNGGPCP